MKAKGLKMILIQDSNSWIGSYIIKGYFISQMVHVNFKFSNLVMTFLLQDILALTNPWNLYYMIFGGHRCGKPLRFMLQHVTYVPVPRFLVIVYTGYYAHYQFQRNPGPRYLWISSQVFQIPRLLTQSLWWLTDWQRWPILYYVIRWSQMKKLQDSLWIIYTSIMAFLTSSPIMVQSSSQIFGNHYSRSLRSRLSYLSYIIFKLVDKQKGLIKS